MISAIQIVLTTGILFLGFYSYKKIRSSYLDAFLIFLFVITGIFFVLFPDYTTVLAHFLGIGRGADLIFYLAILFFSFIMMKLYHKVRGLEQMLTKIIREQSLTSAVSTQEETGK